MLQSQPQNKYLETKVQTATPAQLLIMLYDAAIRNTRQGLEALKTEQYSDSHRSLCKAQEIIEQLAVTLDEKAAISESLSSLYEYFINRLMEGNLQKKTEPVEEVLGHLTQLKETWIQAAKLVTASHAGVNYGTVN